MKITRKQINEGWKLVDGEWVAPDAKGVQVARYDPNGKKERVLLVETRKDLTELEGRRDDAKKPADQKDAQVHAYQRAGLSHAEAVRAAELASGRHFNRG